MVLEDLFLLLHFLPVPHISTRPYLFLPVQMTSGWVSTYSYVAEG